MITIPFLNTAHRLFTTIPLRAHVVNERVTNRTAGTDMLGGTPLHLAAAAGDASSIKDLIAQGATVDARDDVGATPLHFAILGGHETVTRLLVANGANTDARADHGATPRSIARMYGCEHWLGGVAR